MNKYKSLEEIKDEMKAFNYQLTHDNIITYIKTKHKDEIDFDIVDELTNDSEFLFSNDGESKIITILDELGKSHHYDLDWYINKNENKEPKTSWKYIVPDNTPHLFVNNLKDPHFSFNIADFNIRGYDNFDNEQEISINEVNIIKLQNRVIELENLVQKFEERIKELENKISNVICI